MTTSNSTWDNAESVKQLAEEIGRDPVEMTLEQVHLYRTALRKTRQSLAAVRDQLAAYEAL
jgi:hypothetical protein